MWKLFRCIAYRYRGNSLNYNGLLLRTNLNSGILSLRLFSFCFSEIQQWLVDWTPGERGLWHWVHSQPTEAGEHPPSTGTEERTLPWVSRRRRRAGWVRQSEGVSSSNRYCREETWIKGDKESLKGLGLYWERATLGMSRGWQISRMSGGWNPSCAVWSRLSEVYLDQSHHRIFHQMGCWVVVTETINGAEYYYPFAVTIKYKKSTCHCEVLCDFYHKAMLSQ